MNVFHAVERLMRNERAEKSPCKVTLTLLGNGQFAARMAFGPGMESAVAEADTAFDALARLNNVLSGREAEA